MRRICVYCSSSAAINPVYFQAADEVARLFVANDVEIVYGGGAVGLMGKLADTALENNGKVLGIMPLFMKEIEWGHRNVTNFIYTETMHERKAKLMESADALVALPGGTGTLEELLEAISFKRLGLFVKPIVILNTAGFYNPLREMLNKCVEENFMDRRHLDMWTFVDSPGDILPAIDQAAVWSADAINFAVNR